jgi:ELWxxDGT repeat protein
MAPLFVEDKVFFTASDRTSAEPNAIALWTSDGTDAGTRMVKGGFVHDRFAFHPAFSALGLFFFAADHGDGEDLWRSDGTESGTLFLARTSLGFPDPSTGTRESSQPFELGESVFFFSDGSLWSSDGLPEGTVTVRSGLTVSGATQLGNRILFTGCEDQGLDCGLWASDGTAAGTQIISDADVGGYTFRPCSDFGVLMLPYFVTTESHAYFWADGGLEGATLWRTNGTTAGTGVVRGGFQTYGPGATVGDSIVFAGDDRLTGTELWRSDGDELTTRLVRNLMPGSQGGADQVSRTGDRVLFTAPNGQCSRLLASADVNTDQVETVLDGGLFGIDSSSAGSRGWLLFGRRQSLIFSDVPAGIYSTDGTQPATQRIHEAEFWIIWNQRRNSYFAVEEGLYAVDRNGMNTSFISPADVADVVEYTDGILFTTTNGRILWSSEGTLETTRRVITLADRDFVAGSLFAVGKEAYFATADDADRTRSTIWRTDGSEAGTVQLHSFSHSGSPADLPRNFVSLRGAMFFIAGDTASGREIWRIRGDNIVLACDVNPGAADGASSLVAGDERLFFVGDDGIHGDEPWSSDGTTTGTGLLRDIFPGSDSGMPESDAQLSAFDRVLVFAADDGQSGFELWRSDGTQSGTLQVQDIAPGTQGSRPFGFTAAGGRIYFAADDGLHGRELWQMPASAVGAVCTGDCDGSFDVTVDEIVRAVMVGLAHQELATCSAADAEGDGRVTVNDLIVAINNVLHGC